MLQLTSKEMMFLATLFIIGMTAGAMNICVYWHRKATGYYKLEQYNQAREGRYENQQEGPRVAKR